MSTCIALSNRRKKYKQINRITFLFIGFVALFIFFFPAALADSGKDLCQAMLDQINHGIVDAFLENLDPSSSFYQSCTGSNPIIDAMFKICVGGGIFLAIIYGIQRIFTNLDRGMESSECVVKVMRELFIVSLFMINIPTFLHWASDTFGKWIIESAKSAGEFGDQLNLTLEAVCGGYGLVFGPFDFIKTFLRLLLPWVLSLILSIVASFMAYSLLVEMGIRYAFAPLAMADVYGEGLRSPGMRYFKRYMAVFLKIGVAVFGCALCTSFMGSVAQFNSGVVEFFKTIFAIIAIQLTTVGLIGKAGEYANEILGVN